MAARNPSTFTTYVDEDAFEPRRSVLFTEPDQVADDQEFVIDVPRLIVAATWRPIPLTATSVTYIRSVYALGRDLCGLSSTEACSWAAYAWSDSAVDFVVALNAVGAADVEEIDVAADHTSPIWRGWASGVDATTAPTDGTEEEWQIGGLTRGVSGEIVYIAGLAILSP